MCQVKAEGLMMSWPNACMDVFIFEAAGFIKDVRIQNFSVNSRRGRPLIKLLGLCVKEMSKAHLMEKRAQTS